MQLLSPLKDDSYKRNVKYTIRDYAIGIFDVIKKYTSWKSYNNFMKGDTLRKKFNEWSSPRGSEPHFSVARSHRDSTGFNFDLLNLNRWSSEDNIDKVDITSF